LVQQTREVVEEMLKTIAVIDHDLAVARVHALLIAHTTRQGRPRGALDLAVAATAVVSRRLLVTTDAKAKLSGLPGLDVEVVSSSSSGP
jgi:tRNA(fMet)-specific endonuclease VapC